jgi:hypothetical protein
MAAAAAGAVAVAIGKEEAIAFSTKLLAEVLKDSRVALPRGLVETMFSANVAFRKDLEPETTERTIREIYEEMGAEAGAGDLRMATVAGLRCWVSASYSLSEPIFFDPDDDRSFISEEIDSEIEWEPRADSISFSVVPRLPKSLSETIKAWSLADSLSNKVVARIPSFGASGFCYVYGNERLLHSTLSLLERAGIPPSEAELVATPGGRCLKFVRVGHERAERILRAAGVAGQHPIRRMLSRRRM